MFSLLWQFCLEKDLVARGNEIFGGISFPRKTFSFGRDSVRGVGVGAGEICGGIISDISVHFVRCPLRAAKFKITPFFTLDSGKGNSLKRDFQVFYSSFQMEMSCFSFSYG